MRIEVGHGEEFVAGLDYPGFHPQRVQKGALGVLGCDIGFLT